MAVVDLVYTWVNPERSDFARERDRLSELLIGEDQDYRAGNARTRDNGELQYSIESSLRNLPFLRRVYVVCAGGRPAWLPVDTKRIRFVAQESIVPGDIGPSFCSDVVEAFIYKISNLSEQYLYSNDDFFIASPHTKEDFFTVSGDCIIALSSRKAGLGDLNPTFRQMEINSIRALNKLSRPHDVVWPANYRFKQKLKEHIEAALYGIPLVNTTNHVVLPYLKSEWQGFHRVFSEEIRQLCTSPFRSNMGFTINLMYLHHIAGRGRAKMLLDPRHGYLDRRQSPEARCIFATAIRQGRYTRYCLNDAPTVGDDGWVNFLASLFNNSEPLA